MCVTIPGQTAKLNPNTNRTWGIAQQARKITVPNQATGTPVTLEPKPTGPSVKWFHTLEHVKNRIKPVLQSNKTTKNHTQKQHSKSYSGRLADKLLDTHTVTKPSLLLYGGQTLHRVPT